ncbi:MAG TPA: LLM class flavin-dependent oxidoreductase [Candidatus Saccharimonadia bacterium]|nr:LLM class flavin-dependent oxidoreductase [Candidatus Saccharimonadia bacterium]
MIKHFSVLYVGQIELENVGRDGTPADARRYPNERLIESFGMAEEVAVLMDELGFYALWTAEHHFQHEGYECFPNLILLGTYLASRTKRLKFGCGFNIVPMWHPLRLAEDYAMADILTGGRVIFGIGRGYHTREVETFGAPMLDNAANMELFEEQMEVIFKAFNEESFSHQGKHYTLPPRVPYRGYELREITLVPRPIHRPVEIWQPVASGRSIDFMAQHGIKGMLALNGEKLTDSIMHQYQALSAKYGRQVQLGQDMCLGMGFCIDETQQKAIERVRPYHDERYKWFATFGFVRYTDEQGRPWGTPGTPTRLPTIEDGVQQKAWLCGPPAHLIAQLKDIEAKYPGLEHIMLQWPEGMPLREFKEQLRLVAHEVMPAFTGATAAVGAGRTA